MDDAEWQDLKWLLPVGTTVRCKVTTLAPFGFFVEIEKHPAINAVVLAPDFERPGQPKTDVADFPPVGTYLDADVFYHVDQTHQVRLHVGPHVEIRPRGN